MNYTNTDSYNELLLDSLQDPEYAENYVRAVLEEGDEKMLLFAIQRVAEAYSVNEVHNVSKNEVCFSNLAQILDKLGLQLTVRRKVA